MKFNKEKYTKQIDAYNKRNIKYGVSRGQTPEDLTVLLTYIEKLPKGAIYVELGMCDASAIMAVSSHRPDLQCYGIDIQRSAAYFRMREEKGLFPNVHFLHGDAKDFAKTWDKKIDLLFIDTGEHQFPQIFYDFAGWYPYVKKGSDILWHDYEDIERPGPTFQIGLAFEIFRGHQKYKTLVPSKDMGFSTSMAIITKP